MMESATEADYGPHPPETLENVEKDFPPIFDRFFADEKNRRCKKCGTVMPAPAR